MQALGAVEAPENYRYRDGRFAGRGLCAAAYRHVGDHFSSSARAGRRSSTSSALLNDAEHYARASLDQRLAYLERRAQVLHWLVDALGEEGSRYLAQDAEDRALDVRQRAEALAANCGDPGPHRPRPPRDPSSRVPPEYGGFGPPIL
ncbi:hypothetical protein GCM10020219_041070 [Nonomuraea dietziae]